MVPACIPVAPPGENPAWQPTLPRLPLQRKLTIGSPSDPLEAEADAIAESALQGRSLAASAYSSPSLQRKCPCEGSDTPCPTCEKKKEETLARQAAGSVTPVEAPPIVHRVLRSPGQPLDSATRVFFEQRLGADLAPVRVHTDAQAAESARAVNALAYTVGDRIAFAAGHYSPQTAEGRRLLAHELAHTLQQSPDKATRNILRRTPDPISASQDFSALVARLEQIVRTGGPVPTDTRVICAAIIDVEGYKGPKELRTISAAATDTLGEGAPVEHAHAPAANSRTLSATRSIAGGGSRREFPFSHVNDAEIKAFESISKNMPENPRGSVHFLTMRVRQVGGKAVFEPMPACSGCTRATFEMGTFKNVNMISHAATHPTGTLDLGGGPSGDTESDTGPGKKGGGGGAGGGEGNEGGAPTAKRGGSTPNISLGALPEGTEVQPAPANEIIGRQKVLGQLETETAESVRFSARLQAYGAVLGGIMHAYTIFDTVAETLQFAADGTKFPAEQRRVEQLARQSKTDLDAATAVTDGISLLQSVTSVSDAQGRRDIEVLFDLSDAMAEFGMPLRNAADKAGQMADSLELRVKAVEGMRDHFERLAKLPTDPLAGTIPQAQAFTVYQSLELFLGPLNNAAQNYRSAATLLDYYANYMLELAHLANKSAWILFLRRLQAAQAAQKTAPAQHAPPPPPRNLKATVAPPPPTPLLTPPGPAPVQPFQPFPNAPQLSSGPDADTVVANFKSKALELKARGESLLADSPTQQDIKAFAKDEADWRNAATIALKYFTDHGPYTGNRGMDEVLNSDQYGGRLKQLRQSLGE